MKNFKIIFLSFAFSIALQSCQTSGGGVKGNESGSDPINEEEAIQYKQTLIRCQKTGGSRIVKIEGQLRCF